MNKEINYIGTVYVLELTGGHYYIGFTQNLQRRLAEHEQGCGSEWTKLYRPTCLLEIVENADVVTERQVTLRYMHKFGWKNVRGAAYTMRDMAKVPYPIERLVNRKRQLQSFSKNQPAFLADLAQLGDWKYFIRERQLFGGLAIEPDAELIRKYCPYS